MIRRSRNLHVVTVALALASPVRAQIILRSNIVEERVTSAGDSYTGAIVLSGPLVRVWVGSRYDDAAGLIAVALAYLTIVAPLQVGSNLLIALGRARAIPRSRSRHTSRWS